MYVPKLYSVLQSGYRRRDLRDDLLAGLTVAIVALPLAMALAIASGASPDKGLYTAIVAGFLISWRWGLLMIAAVLLAWLVLTRAFELGKTRESGPERVLPTVGERPIPGRVIRKLSDEEA